MQGLWGNSVTVCTHNQGHEHNLEGQSRLSFPVLGDAEEQIESENQKCSRLKKDGICDRDLVNIQRNAVEARRSFSGERKKNCGYMKDAGASRRSFSGEGKKNRGFVKNGGSARRYSAAEEKNCSAMDEAHGYHRNDYMANNQGDYRGEYMDAHRDSYMDIGDKRVSALSSLCHMDVYNSNKAMIPFTVIGEEPSACLRVSIGSFGVNMVQPGGDDDHSKQNAVRAGSPSVAFNEGLYVTQQEFANYPSGFEGNEYGSNGFVDQNQMKGVAAPNEGRRYVIPIGDQHKQMVKEANEASKELIKAIDNVNIMLASMEMENQMIPSPLITKMETHMQCSIYILAAQNEDLRGNYRNLQNQIAVLQEEVEEVIKDKTQLMAELVAERSKSKGLNPRQHDRLISLGFPDVNTLINEYIILRDTVEQTAGIQTGLSTSRISLCSTQRNTPTGYRIITPRPQIVQQPQGVPAFVQQNEGIATQPEMAHDNKAIPFSSASKSKIPEPEKFRGTTRVELERFFRYFEPFAEDAGMNDERKALIVGYYVPTLIAVHDELMQRNATYEEVKKELLNSLGSDSSIATFSLRMNLDKISKLHNQTYRSLLEDVEKKVVQAYGYAKEQKETELKKILLRVAEEDPDTLYSSTLLPHTSEGYYRLKELVLGTEDANIRRKQADGKDPNSRRYFSDKRSDGRSSPEKQTYAPRRSNSFADESGSRKCFNCGKANHLARDCRTPVAQVLENAKRSNEERYNLPYSVDGITLVGAITNAENRPKMTGQKTLLEARLDGVKIVSMLDSGACVSIIRKQTLNKILQNKSRGGKITREREGTYKKDGLITANGSKINVVDCVRIPISWGIHPPTPAIFYVVEGLQQEVLIGTNVLHYHEIWLEALMFAVRNQTTIQKQLPSQSSVAFELLDSKKAKRCSLKGVNCVEQSYDMSDPQGPSNEQIVGELEQASVGEAKQALKHKGVLQTCIQIAKPLPAGSIIHPKIVLKNGYCSLSCIYLYDLKQTSDSTQTPPQQFADSIRERLRESLKPNQQRIQTRAAVYSPRAEIKEGVKYYQLKLRDRQKLLIKNLIWSITSTTKTPPKAIQQRNHRGR